MNMLLDILRGFLFAVLWAGSALLLGFLILPDDAVRASVGVQIGGVVALLTFMLLISMLSN